MGILLNIALALIFVASAHGTNAAELSEVRSYPVKPVRIGTGAAGNAIDISARLLAQQLSEKWGKQVIIENRAGQAMLSAEITAKAPPDGYTLCMGEFSSFAAAPNMQKQLAYDPVRDFAPITLVMKSPFVLVANPALPVANLQNLVEQARKRPGDLKYATQSSRSASNLTMKMFIHALGIDMLHVPYKRAADSVTSVLSGETDVSFLATLVGLQYRQGGKLKILAISSAHRLAIAPDIPTVDESGIPGFEVVLWSGMVAPAQTPPRLVEKLNRDMTEILRRPSTVASMLKDGGEVAPTTPEEFSAFIKSEIVKWGTVIKAAGIKPE